MATNFPALTPTNRSFSAPVYPVTVYRSQSGTSVRRLWASQPSNARLSLSFTNIADADVALILTCYNSARGSIDTLTLPSNVFNGAETALTAFLSQAGTVLDWHFADDSPPKVDSVVPGRSSVTLELIASLDYS
jgi:hypothetical protein